ncbi:CbrC family protein [Paenibacillus silviterrae]|nr:CbrC family protein [Paenibacillus chinjuensis]
MCSAFGDRLFCNKKSEYVYKDPFYRTADVEGICPWCIADGNAAKKC